MKRNNEMSHLNSARANFCPQHHISTRTAYKEVEFVGPNIGMLSIEIKLGFGGIGGHYCF